MSDYQTSITDLYNLKKTLAQLKADEIAILQQLATRESIKWRRQLSNVRNQIIQIQQQIKNSVTSIYNDPKTDPLLQINEANPLLLLPLRMETRFANGGSELWVRVYPDEIALHHHETALTEPEVQGGKYYWRYLWQNQNSPPSFDAHRKKAWSQLANRFGVNRTPWIILKTTPLKVLPGDNFTNILTEADLDAGQIHMKSKGWSEALKSFVMPDLLKLQLYIAGKRVLEVTGNPIVHPLPVGPDPKNTSTNTNNTWTGTDLEWLEDFDRAVVVGMAFKVQLSAIPSYDPAIGFDLVTVTGIRTLFDDSPLQVPPPAAGAKALANLLESHQYSHRGLALVPQGTATNNTEENKSGYNGQLSFSEERYQTVFQSASPVADEDNMEDGKILAMGLGLDPAVLQKLENSQHTDHRDAVAINKALFPATLGFYLRHLLHPLFKTEEIEVIRTFFCSKVTGRGPLPVLKTGAQPYGILPTSNFKRFKGTKADVNSRLFQRVTELLIELEKVYEAEIPNLPKLGQTKAPHQLLNEILECNASSEAFFQRVGYTENFLRNFLGQNVNTSPNPFLEQLIQRFSAYTGIAAEGILALKKIVFERTTLPLNRNKVVDIVLASESKTISIPTNLSPAIHRGENYIGWLSRIYVRAPLSGLERDYYSATDPRIEPPLLYLLLKQSMLLLLYRCVFHWLSTHGHLDPKLTLLHNGTATSDFISSKEYLNLFLNSQDISPMELLLIEGPMLPFLAGGETAAAYFLNNSTKITQDVFRLFRRRVPPQLANDFRNLADFFPTLDYLSQLTTARLERATSEHLDCLTYRIDAWQTGLFYKKLQENRAAGAATGTVLGAYGWLENLKPASNIKYINTTDLPAELQPAAGSIITQAVNSGGYIQTPSLTQAKAAAILRNAYLHHHDPGNPQMMAVNLRSQRVRMALEMFEGMEDGHSLNELLGYRLERYLHDQTTPLDKYIPPLRAAFPLRGKTISNPAEVFDNATVTQSQQPAEWVSRLDGLAIINAIKSGKTYPFGITAIPSTGNEADALQAGISDLLNCIDAMKDLMVAEGIHQVVQGNTDRAGALLKSVNELKPPPRFESIRTPRTPAEILTHRACIFFTSGDFTKPKNPWPTVSLSQRARTEPALNEWLAEIIGAPDMYQCTVTETKTGVNAVVSAADLNLQPIDLVYLAPAQLEGEESDFSRRIVHHFRSLQKITDDTAIEIDYNATVKNNPGIGDLLPLLKLLKELITNSKVMNAADVDLQQYQGKANPGNLSIKKSPRATADTGYLVIRIQQLRTALEALAKKLKQLSGTRTPTMCEDMRKCLLECCDFDIRDAFPVSSYGEDAKQRDALVKQAESVIAQMQKMLDSLPKSNPAQAEELIKVFSLFFGAAFKVMPVFHFTQNGQEEVDRVQLVHESYHAGDSIFSFVTGKSGLTAQKHLQNWINEMTYMRPVIGSFEKVRLLYHSFHGKRMDVNVMQLPYEKNENWLGLEFPADQTVGKGKLSLLYHHLPKTPAPDFKSGEFSGLVLDEWVEEIPVAEEVTGLTFQYNQPNSEPPQTMLLAISPTEGANWTWETLHEIITDTLRRAKQRAVHTRHLAKTDWIGSIPGAIGEFCDTKANLSLFFRN